MNPPRAFQICLLACGLLLSGVTGAATAAAWTYHEGWFGSRVTGSGKVVTEARAVGSFQAISAAGVSKVVLRQGNREGASVTGDDNIVPLIETRVVDGKRGKTLEIGVRTGSGYTTDTEIVVTVDFKSLSAIATSGSTDVEADAIKAADLAVSIAGSGDIRLGTLTADELKVSVAGSGDFTARGQVGSEQISVAGSGDVKTQRLEAMRVKVSIAGSGTVRVAAREELNVSIAGSGDVIYSGEPRVTKSVVGSGSVQRR